MGAQNVSANTFTNQSENQPDEVSVSVTSSSQEETEVVTNNVTDYKKEESENVINEISVVADQSKTLETEIKTSEISKESESKGDIVDPTEKISGTKVTVQSSNTKLDAEVRQSKEEGEVLNNNTTQIQPEKFVEKSQESNESVKATQNEDVRVPKVKENISFNWDNVPNAVDVFENGSLLVEKRGAIIEWITEPTFGKEFAYASVKYPDNPKVEIIKIPVKVSSAATRRERNVTFNENDTFRMVVDHQSIVDKGTGRVTGQEKTPAYYTITATPDKKHNRVDFSVKYTVGSSYVRTHRAVLGVELGEGFQQPGAIQASVSGTQPGSVTLIKGGTTFFEGYSPKSTVHITGNSNTGEFRFSVGVNDWSKDLNYKIKPALFNDLAGHAVYGNANDPNSSYNYFTNQVVNNRVNKENHNTSQILIPNINSEPGNENGNSGTYIIFKNPETHQVIKRVFIKDGHDGVKGEKGDRGEQGAKGDRGEKGQDGVNGKDGKSATITITDNNNGTHTVRITNPDGSSSDHVIKDGKDGKSATATTKDNAGGTHTITITNPDNTTQTITVRDGAKGDRGEKGQDGVNGKDGKSATITITDNNNGTHTVRITNPDGSSSDHVIKDGKDGKSATATTKDNADGTHTITIINPDNTTQMIIVRYGRDGRDGKDYKNSCCTKCHPTPPSPESDKPVGNVTVTPPPAGFDKPEGKVTETTPPAGFDKPEEKVTETTPPADFDKPEGKVTETTPPAGFDKPEGKVTETTPPVRFDKPEGKVTETIPPVEFEKPNIDVPTYPNSDKPYVSVPPLPSVNRPQLNMSTLPMSDKSIIKTASFAGKDSVVLGMATKEHKEELPKTAETRSELVSAIGMASFVSGIVGLKSYKGKYGKS